MQSVCVMPPCSTVYEARLVICHGCAKMSIAPSPLDVRLLSTFDQPLRSSFVFAARISVAASRQKRTATFSFLRDDQSPIGSIRQPIRHRWTVSTHRRLVAANRMLATRRTRQDVRARLHVSGQQKAPRRSIRRLRPLGIRNAPRPGQQVGTISSTADELRPETAPRTSAHLETRPKDRCLANSRKGLLGQRTMQQSLCQLS
jgi:hypothetical protein